VAGNLRRRISQLLAQNDVLVDQTHHRGMFCSFLLMELQAAQKDMLYVE
jgi:hypothetical protein